MNKYLFIDIDGTLRSKTTYQIPKSAYKTLALLKEKGYQMGIATGRGLFSARMFGEELGMDYVISDGGRCVLLNGKIIYSNYIDNNIVDRVTSFAKNNGFEIGYSNHYAIHSTSDVFSKAFDLDQTILCSIKKEVDVNKLFGLTKLYLWGDKDIYEKDPFMASIEHHWLREKLCVIEHMHKDEGIVILEKELGLNKEDMIAFGDDVNDITMFNHCAISVCMGNGNDQTKAHASYVTDHIDNDGILKACLALKLIEEEDL